MKNLWAALAVTVFLNSGKVFHYPEATYAHTTGGSSPLIGANSADTVLTLENENGHLIAAFPLHNVERWEMK